MKTPRPDISANEGVRAAAAALLAAAAILAAASLQEAPGAAPAPGWSDFTLSTPSGEQVSLSDFVGKKPVLLAFWATWCPYCNAAVPRLSAVETGPLRERVKILAIDYLESREKVGAFVRAKRIPYTVLLDRDGAVSRRFGIAGVPTYVLIGRDGRVAFRENALPDDLEKFLR